METTKKKKALVTGASSGIGEHMARLLAQKGYDFILVARSEQKLRKITHELEKEFDASCSYFVCDLSRESDVERLIKAYPETDLLINNAGSGSYGFYHKAPWQRVKDMIMVNAVAACRLCHQYLPGMLARDSGKILNVASTAGLGPLPFMATYAATKAFLIEFSESLALEARGKNVTVSCLLPGPTGTDFWYVSGAAAKVQKAVKRYAHPKAVARFGVQLMEEGRIAGIPGWNNKLKASLRHYMPRKMWGCLIKKHMAHQSLHANRA